MDKTDSISLDPADRRTAGRHYGGEAPEDRVARRRRQFMDAGLKLFGTGGYRSATVRALCREAQLTDRYFYESFASTEALFTAVYRREIDDMKSRLLASVGAPRPDADLPAVFERALDAFFTAAENPLVARTVWVEIMGVNERLDQLYFQTLAEFGDMLLTLFRQFFPHWQVSPAQQRIIAVAMVGAVSQSVTSWLLSGFKDSRSDMVAANALLLNGLLLQAQTALPRLSS